MTPEVASPAGSPSSPHGGIAVSPPLEAVARAVGVLEQRLTDHPADAVHANVPARATWSTQREPGCALALPLSIPSSADGPARHASAAMPWQPHDDGLADGQPHEVFRCDMGPEFASGRAGPSPAWLFRAGIAGCAVTSIVLQAARRGLAIERVACEVHSESDLRGLLGLGAGTHPAVPVAPFNVRLRVWIDAPGEPVAEVESLVTAALRCSPVQAALCTAVPVAVQVDGPAGR